MSYKLFIGADTSKAKFDFTGLDNDGHKQLATEVSNCSTTLTLWLSELLDGHSLSASQILICIERSGIYSLNLAYIAHEMGFTVWMEDALHLAHSFGRVRGKTDAVDAARIAKYAQRNWQDMKPFNPENETVTRIRSLVKQRLRMIKTKNILLVPINEEQEFATIPIDDLHQSSREVIEKMEKTIKGFDDQIDQLIEADKQLKQKATFAMSVPGFKKVNFRNLVISTEGFTRLDNPRALACNIGIAPFPRQSGKCLNKKPTIGKMGNKSFKTTLTCAVMSVIGGENRFGQYYRRKMAEGKKHLVVVNALRNKMLHTVLACIKNEAMYEEKSSHKLAGTIAIW